MCMCNFLHVCILHALDTPGLVLKAAVWVQETELQSSVGASNCS